MVRKSVRGGSEPGGLGELLWLVPGELERVLRPEASGGRPSVALPIGLARRLDPQEGVHQRMAGLGGGEGAEPLAARVAPLAVAAESVAARVDDEVLVAEQGGHA